MDWMKSGGAVGESESRERKGEKVGFQDDVKRRGRKEGRGEVGGVGC
jgi:hypothetical protein